MKTHILFLAGFFVVSQYTAQTVQINQQANLGGTNNDIAESIVRTSDGGFIVAGYTNSNNGDVTGAISGEDAWIIKLSSAGTLQWKRIYGGSSDDRAHAIIQTSNGDYVFAGTTNSSNGTISGARGGFDAWVVRLNPNGNVIWSRNLGGSDDDAFFDLFEAPNGAIALGGESKSDISGTQNQGGYDYYLAAVSASGSTLLQKQYGGSSDDRARAIARLGSSILLAGTTDSDNGQVSNNKGSSDVWVVKTSGTGNIQFARTYGGADNDEGFALATSGTDFFVAGASQSSNADLQDNNGGRDFYVVKANVNGNIIYSRNYGGDSDDVAYSIVTTPDGGVAVAGYSTSNDQDVSGNYGGRDQWFVKLNAAGNLTIEQNFGGSDDDEARSMIYIGGTGYVMAGYSESDNVDLNNNKGNADYWLHRFSIVFADNAAKNATLLSENWVRTFPNPAVQSFRIESSSEIEIVRIYDLTGKMVKQLTINGNSTDVEVSELPAGVYLIQISQKGGEVSMEKMSIQ